MGLVARARSAVPWTAVITGSSLASRAIVMLAAARFLSPYDLGLFAIVGLVLGFAGLFADGGLTQSVVSTREIRPEQLSSLHWCNVLFGAAAGLVLCLATPGISRLYAEPRLTGMLLLAAVNFAITPFGQVSQTLLQKQLNFSMLGRIEVASNTTGVLVALALLAAGVGIYALILAQLATALLRSVLLRIAGRALVQTRLRLRPDEVKPFLRFGFFQVGDRAMNFVNTKVDQLLIGGLLGPEALGYYNMAWTVIVEPVYRINPIITTVAFPVFARRQDNRAALRRGFLIVTKLLSTTNAPVVFGIAAIAPIAVPLVLGEQWRPSVPLVELLAIVAIARAIYNPVGSLVLAVGRADLSFYRTVTQFAVQTPIYAALLYAGGLVPATWFICLVNVAAVPLTYLFMLRPTLGPFSLDYTRSFLPAVSLALAMAVAVRLLATTTSIHPRIGMLAAQLALGAVLYGGMTILFRREDVGEMAGLMISRP
ncbi:MAG TPA: MOP flippase family protein [Stellaceae bacterium]|nr:MOP flippase family protein [Stellaceae bacterium]